MRVIANLAGLKHKYGQNANKVAGAAEGLGAVLDVTGLSRARRIGS
jgi:hypothetical protein